LKFSLAVKRVLKKDESDFISCIAWAKTAEIMHQYLHKGSLIGVSGRIQTGSYDNQKGNKVYTSDVIVDTFNFLESKNTRNIDRANERAVLNDDHPPLANADDFDISDEDLPF
jgi:single-strand DNA-binding protein